MFCIEKIKVVSLIHYIQEKLQLEAGRLRNVNISGQKFKYICMYERGGKGIQSLFKSYQYALP